ncbi:4Fe-4S binding protein [Thermodesulfatator autotrophicus]|uniref:Protochlorophyllide oxidoreductase n=1 Tax=Thermodesulfatator autotrophicus TaxID=1795632 RepID=A0A177E7K8_9BACT|nr:4Fe-4S binding protein [Thermodesulfatator autotrophicus]OAG27875.1 protochlorophyllide oxidoreductase [Thermodesulfatator autotrophicus]
MKWEPEAEALLKRVPFFVRKKVKKKVEEFVRARGEATVTRESMLAAREALRDKAAQAEKAFSVEGCFGISNCPNAVTSSEELLNHLEKILEEKELTSFLKEKIKGPLKHHHQFKVSLAECPNACSQVQIKDFALIGQAVLALSPERCSFCGECEKACEEKAVVISAAGPEIDKEKCLGCGACARVCETEAISIKEKGYRLLIGGKLGRHPQLAQEIKSFANEAETLEIFSKVLDFYKRHCQEGERLGAIIARLGFEQAIKEILG